MLLPTITLKKHCSKGLGLFASEFIPQGTVIWFPCKKCSYYPSHQLSLLSNADFQMLNELGYTTYDNGILLPCSNACYMNHSCDPNVLDYGLDFGVAVKDIKANDEICCDYHAWDTEEFEMVCKCNSKNCLGNISPRKCDSNIKRTWSSAVQTTLTKMKNIKQPLHNQLLECSDVYTQQQRDEFNYLSDETISVKTIKKNWMV